MNAIRMIWLALLLATAATAARAADCDPFAASVATEPAPYQYPRGLEHARGLLAAVPRQADIILIGDSLAANWPVDLLRQQFAGDRIWNFAVGGSVTQNALWQLERLDVAVQKVRDVIVVIGTNNLTREDMPACAIAAGIESVVNAAHAKWPSARIHVMGIPPRGADFHFRDSTRLAVNRELEAWARGRPFTHYFEVVASQMTCGLYDLPLTSQHSVRPPCENYADDFGHFKRAGYDIIFRELAYEKP